MNRPFPLALIAAACAAASAHASPPADATSLSLEQLLEVSVVGAAKYEQKQSEVAAAVSVITRGEIKAFGWRTIDQALASLPGVYTTYDRQYSYLGTRGFGVPGDFNTRVLLTVNGNRVNDPLYDAAPMGAQFTLDLDLVERIEFIPGPGGAVYGQNAMFGVVNVVTRGGADLGGTELAASWQAPQATRTGRLSWGRRLDNGVEVLLSATRMRSRGDDLFVDFGSAGVSGVARGLDGDRDHEVFARVSRGPWAIDLIHGFRRKDDPTGAYFSDPLAPGQYQGDGSTLVQGSTHGSFAGNTLDVSARVFAGWERYRSRLNYGTPFLFPADSHWRGAELRAVSTAFRQHKLMLGLEAQDDARRDQQIVDPSDPANDIRIPRSGYRVGVYAQDEWRLAEPLTATLGLRIDRNDIVGSRVSPRAALIWQASGATTAKALYGRAHRAPNAYERDYEDGQAQVANPDLSGERVDTLELVLDHRVGRQWALRGAFYHWTMRDLIALAIDPVSGLPQYRTGDRVEAHGLELSSDRTWDSGARLRASVSLQEAKARAGKLVNSPRLLAKAALSSPLPWAGLRVGAEWRYEGRRLTLDGSSLGGYALTSVNLVTEALAPGLELSLKVDNLFDKAHAHPGADSNWQNALPQDGRSLRAGLAWRF